MDCSEYIDHFLSAHADGELAPDETRAVEAHLRGCARCRTELEGERTLKSRLNRIALEKAPAGLVTRVGRALDAAAAPGRQEPASPRARFAYRWLWIPTALAAMLAVAILFAYRPTARNSEHPLFDQAITEFAMFETGFVPNVPSETETGVALSSDMTDMPVGIWNFERSGYHLLGGRPSRIATGEPITYAYYRGPEGQGILCMRLHGVKITPPAGAVMQIGSHLLYNYHGLSICLTVSRVSDFTGVLVSGEPVAKLARIISLAAANLPNS